MENPLELLHELVWSSMTTLEDKSFTFFAKTEDDGPLKVISIDIKTKKVD